VKPMPAIDDALRKVSGYEVMGHRLEFIGVCPACRKEGPLVRASQRPRGSISE
jgi:Fe2+ or Zn2+ uptake regulation protein